MSYRVQYHSPVYYAAGGAVDRPLGKASRRWLALSISA